MRVHTVVMDHKEYKTFSKLVLHFLRRVQVHMLSVPPDLVDLLVDSAAHLVVCAHAQLVFNWLWMAQIVTISTNALSIMVVVLIAAQILRDHSNVHAQKTHRFELQEKKHTFD